MLLVDATVGFAGDKNNDSVIKMNFIKQERSMDTKDQSKKK